MYSFSYVRGFPMGFYTVTSFKEASGDNGYLFIAAAGCSCLCLSYLSCVPCIFRPRGSVRFGRPEMMDGGAADAGDDGQGIDGRARGMDRGSS